MLPDSLYLNQSIKMESIKDKWNNSDSYEYFMGRWSSLMAVSFLEWLNVPAGKNWLDIGCGTGALSEAIEKQANPHTLSGIDASKFFIDKAKQRLLKPHIYTAATVDHLPFENEKFEILVSGLAFNFFPDPEKALLEIKRVSKPKAIIAAYVWDYAGKMEFLRYFWDAAYSLDSNTKNLDEGIRFPICNTEKLSALFQKMVLKNVVTSFLDIETVFKDFDDYWNPFLGGQGPAPGYLQSLDTKSQLRLKNEIQQRITLETDGSIRLIGRAIVVKGTV